MCSRDVYDNDIHVIMMHRCRIQIGDYIALQKVNQD